MNNNTQQATFWQFLQEHTIEIPIIQRDYAQGRKGKEKLREKFLADLKSALDGDGTLPNEKVLKLDFVYGSIENGNLNPLDGQQRLTTLWLLHWYIAYKTGKLSENSETFKRFTYETRVSSREFCEKLSDFTTPQPVIKDEKGNEKLLKIVKHIQNQTWFFSAWKQDPTIQAMLNMLGGTPLKDKKGDDIVDGIEEVFKDNTENDFKKYWKGLTSQNSQKMIEAVKELFNGENSEYCDEFCEKLGEKYECPIIFYYLPLYELKLSDDLYIKMNARGKQLTSFENFKADLVGHIKSKGWEKGKSPQETIAHKLDTTWTDIFWKNKSGENKIDNIYFAFLNRYFLNALIIAKKENDYLFEGENLEKYNKTFSYLNDNLNGIREYSGFDVYNPKIKSEKDVFEKAQYEQLEKVLDNFYLLFKAKGKNISEINKLFLPPWGGDEFKFIPEYPITTLTQSQKTQKTQKIVFHAICCYFENNQYNKTIFNQWMRVVWNIVENTNTDIQSMIDAMCLIDEIKSGVSGVNNIYKFLADANNKITSGTAKDQLEEEREKAKQILDENGNLRTDANGINWEVKITEAENYAFFKGAIRFLFTDEDGKYDWNMFDTKFLNAKKYFKKEGVVDEYQENVKLLKSLISKIEMPDKTLREDQNKTLRKNYRIFNHNGSTWKNILIDSQWKNAVSSILSGDLSIKDSSHVAWHQKLYRTDLLEYVANIENKLCDSRIQKRHGHIAIYPGVEGVFLDADNRDKILSQLADENKISPEKRIPKTDLFDGWYIRFQYNDNESMFRWDPDEKIYLLDSNQQRVLTRFFDSKGKNVEEVENFLKKPQP
jgi:hypothetical protein